MQKDGGNLLKVSRSCQTLSALPPSWRWERQITAVEGSFATFWKCHGVVTSLDNEIGSLSVYKHTLSSFLRNKLLFRYLVIKYCRFLWEATVWQLFCNKRAYHQLLRSAGCYPMKKMTDLTGGFLKMQLFRCFCYAWKTLYYQFQPTGFFHGNLRSNLTPDCDSSEKTRPNISQF